MTVTSWQWPERGYKDNILHRWNIKSLFVEKSRLAGTPKSKAPCWLLVMPYATRTPGMNTVEINHIRTAGKKSNEEWSSQLWTQSTQLRKKAEKKFQYFNGFEPVPSRYRFQVLKVSVLERVPNVIWERESARKGLNATSGTQFAALPLVKPVYRSAHARCRYSPCVVLTKSAYSRS